MKRCRNTERRESRGFYRNEQDLTPEQRMVTHRCWRLHDHSGPCDFETPHDPHGPDGFPAEGQP